MYFSPDRTKFECVKYKKLVDELKRRKAIGETNLIIWNNAIVNRCTRIQSSTTTPNDQPMLPTTNPTDKTSQNWLLQGAGLQTNCHNSDHCLIKQSLKLVIANCRSIVNKHAGLETLLQVQKLDLFVGTESHLDEAILSSEIFSSHYTVYQNDRNWHGGGVFILVNNEVPSSLLQVSISIKQIWIHIHIKNKQSIIYWVQFIFLQTLLQLYYMN